MGAVRSPFPPTGVIDADPRADGAVRLVSVSDGRVVIDRMVGGVLMRLGLSCAAYRGVVLTFAGNPDAPTFVIRLLHADPELSVALFETRDDADIIAHWRAVAAQTGLPRFIEHEPGLIDAIERRLGPVTLGRARPVRRRGSSAVRRRPRFLTRRRLGERRLMKPIV
jgi:hypothetical protein